MPTDTPTIAPLLVSDTPLSFWGGLDPLTGDIIDEHHPLHGSNVVDQIFALPGSRGSCSGSGVLLEIIMTGKAPAALVFYEQEEILVLGALVADIMFDHPMPLLLLEADAFKQLESGIQATIIDNTLSVSTQHGDVVFQGVRLDVQYPGADSTSVTMSAEDRDMLGGKHGKATQVAMQILVCMASIQGARDLITITQAHIDSCVYHGLSSLHFAKAFIDWGASVSVPTTLNAVSVDKRQWQAQGINPEFGKGASALADAYMEMGAQLSYTCAPYLLNTAPEFGEQIVWAESNAVAYANSVLGARTQKYPDFLDVCIAITGRAPNCGAHQDSGRVPSVHIKVTLPNRSDDSFWPLLGYHIGLLTVNDIPIIYGLESTAPTDDQLKAFSAAFATTSSVPLFHLAAITPEVKADSDTLKRFSELELPVLRITPTDLSASWKTLNSADSNQVNMICLGNPHFSFTECASLALLCDQRTRSTKVAVIVTLSRAINALCDSAGITEKLEAFGVQLINDTCWCMLQQPVIPPAGSILMTNSAKYAHYAPGLVNRPIHFGSLADCVDAACDGHRTVRIPEWLTCA